MPHPASAQDEAGLSTGSLRQGNNAGAHEPAGRPLSLDEYRRYGRQMILPGFGLEGQLKLKAARVAVVGAGGLGCPALQYLAGAGVGHITVIDHDTVSVSNLHRQVLHSTSSVGTNKALSACVSMRALNPHPTYAAISDVLLPSSALPVLGTHDLVLDCTDRPTTRYVVSDACAALGIPLVSGAAVATAGQWGVLCRAGSRGAHKTACYRCLWPHVGRSGTCEDVGVLGVVTGFVGVGMAAEAVRVLLGQADEQHVMHLFALGQNPLTRTVRLRRPRADCAACGDGARLDVATYDYAEFCAGAGAGAGNGGEVVGLPGQRIGAKDLAERLGNAVVVDTRPAVEFGICAIPGSVNMPLADILQSPNSVPDADIVFVCRRGNDSQVAARAVRAARLRRAERASASEARAAGEGAGAGEAADEADDEAAPAGRAHSVVDVRGGLVAWARDVDPTFPTY
ncbi:hypothetical protein Q5752_007053 [Cryptotrichosporon argae]